MASGFSGADLFYMQARLSPSHPFRIRCLIAVDANRSGLIALSVTGKPTKGQLSRSQVRLAEPLAEIYKANQLQSAIL